MTQAVNLANFANNLDTSGGLNPSALNSAVPVSKGGTAATTAASARTNLGLAIGTDIPSVTGTGASGTWGVNISGNAATASSATNASYASSSGYASSAGSASNASYAGSAGYAGYAGSAGYASAAGYLTAGAGFNTVGSYVYGYVVYNSIIYSGTSWSAGSGYASVVSYGAGTSQPTINLSGTWRWMGGTALNISCCGFAYATGVYVRIA